MNFAMVNLYGTLFPLHNKHVRSLAYPSWGPSVRIPYLLHVMVLNSIKGFSITVFVKKLHGNVVLHDLKSHFYPLGKSIFVTHKVKTPSSVSTAQGQGDILLLHITIDLLWRHNKSFSYLMFQIYGFCLKQLWSYHICNIAFSFCLLIIYIHIYNWITSLIFLGMLVWTVILVKIGYPFQRKSYSI